MIFRQKDFWEKVTKGSEVVVKRSDGHKPEKLYYDEIREFNDYGLNMLYVCLQRDPKDIGNRSLSVPIVVDDIEDVVSVGGKPVKEFRKEIKAMQKKSEKIEPVDHPVSLPSSDKPELLLNELAPEPHTKSDGKTVKQKSVPRKRKEYDFVITEKDGKFICPCGSSFGRRDTAIWCHRKKQVKN